MQYALIKDGVCVNVIEADASFIEKIRSDYTEILQAEEAEIGAGWDGATFTRNESETPVVTPTVDPLEDIKAQLAELSADVKIIKDQTKLKV